jgi:DNA-3-methyladenine glycosylase
MSECADRPLSAEFYARDTVSVARGLLGCVLESRVGGSLVSGRIVEVEAYVGADDPADHGYGNKKTGRNAALFGPPGSCYVYFIYGMHWCFNAVTEEEGVPTAVLVRALEPQSGIELMRKRRGVREVRLLCSGPARLSEALGITGSLNGSSLIDGPVRILNGRGLLGPVSAGPRIGVSRGRSRQLRFVEHGSKWLSRPAP